MSTQETPITPRRVRYVDVEKLFGLYDHHVELNLTDRVTVLHGPNGVGKTILLTLIANSLGSKLDLFCSTPMERFQIVFTDGQELTTLAARITKKNGTKGPFIVVTNIREASGEVWESSIAETSTSFDDKNIGVASISQRNPSLQDEKRRTLFRLPVHFIQTQRLTTTPADPPSKARNLTSTIASHAADLVNRSLVTIARLNEVAQELEQSFPVRLLDPSLTPLSADTIYSELNEINRLRGDLQAVGLSEKSRLTGLEPSALAQLDDSARKTLTLYIQDARKKINTLLPFVERLQLLLNSVNPKLDEKTLSIDTESGLKITNSNNIILSLDRLSSGEQHLIVMLYELLFLTMPGTLVLIDEPELSLHIEWQRDFIQDLLKIAKFAELDVLIATHSPYIVGDRSDLLVELSGKHP